MKKKSEKTDELKTDWYTTPKDLNVRFRLSRFYASLPILVLLTLTLISFTYQYHFLIGLLTCTLPITIIWLLCRDGLKEELKPHLPLTLTTGLSALLTLVAFNLIQEQLTILYLAVGLLGITFSLLLALAIASTRQCDDECRTYTRISFGILPIMAFFGWLPIVIALCGMLYFCFWMAHLVPLFPLGKDYYKYKRWDSRLSQSHCPNCDYNLSHHTDERFNCPECGIQMYREQVI